MKKKRSASKPTPKVVTSPDNIPTGALTVTVEQFRSLGALSPLVASLGGWTGFKMPNDEPLPEPPPTLEIDGDNIKIKSEYPVRLIYNLPDARYVLVGAAWEELLPNTVGKTAFPDVLMRRNVTMPVPYGPPLIGGSCLTVKDNAQTPGAYHYVLIIQDANTAEIGIYDPPIENEPEK